MQLMAETRRGLLSSARAQPGCATWASATRMPRIPHRRCSTGSSGKAAPRSASHSGGAPWPWAASSRSYALSLLPPHRRAKRAVEGQGYGQPLGEAGPPPPQPLAFSGPLMWSRLLSTSVGSRFSCPRPPCAPEFPPRVGSHTLFLLLPC